MKLRFAVLCCSIAACSPSSAPTQSSTSSATAVASAAAPIPPGSPGNDREFLHLYAESRAFRRGFPRNVRITPDGKSVLFLRSGPTNPTQSLYETVVATGETRLVLAPDTLQKGNEQLSAEERARRERMRVTAQGFTSFLMSRDGKTLIVGLSGKLYTLDRSTGTTSLLDLGKGAAVDPHLSPNGKLLAYVQDDDVHVATLDGSRKPRPLTRGGTPARPHGLADFCASEELDRYEGLVWSPDSSAILYEEADGSKLEKLSIIDPGHPENDPDIVPYPRAGHANAVLRFGIVKLDAPERTTWVEWDRERSPYVATVTWSEHAPPTLVVLDRLQKDASVLLVDPLSGKTREALHEHDDAWVNVDPSVPRWLADGSAFLWMSERDGDRRFGLVSGSDGHIDWLTPRGLQADEVLDVDDAHRSLIFEGTRDALHQEVLRVPLEGGEPSVLARVEDGSAYGSFEERNHAVFLSREVSLSKVRRLTLRSIDGKVLGEVPSVAAQPALPRVELSTVGPDGVRIGIVRPRRGAGSDSPLPVIDSAYGGPHDQEVSLEAEAWLLPQWLADATGAAVVKIDAKGTPNRGRAWERALLGKLGEVPLEGHVAALGALTAAHPEFDASRMGIYGWSFGGYLATLAVLRRPDVFSAGVAIAPVSDWRDYDTAYTERYLGLPETEAAAYDLASVLTYAKEPPPPREPSFLLMHGTADDNVYFLNSVKLADTLAKAGRTFRFLPFIAQTHQFASPEAMEAVWMNTARSFRAAFGGLEASSPPR